MVFTTNGQSIYFTKTQRVSNGAPYEALYKKVGNENIQNERHLKWTQSEQGTVVSIVVHPKNALIVYIVARDGSSTSVYKSSDGGDRWQKQIGAISTTYQLLIHPNYPKQLIFVDGPTVSFSSNGGNSWETLSFSSLDEDEGEAIISAIFNPKNRTGLFLFTHKGVYETKDLGENLSLLNTDFNGAVGSFFQAASNEVFISSSASIFKLTNKAYTQKEENCLFAWAEQQYPTFFSPALVDTQAFGDYSYRYYDNTDTYLGFFQHDKIHLLKAGKSNEIKEVGFIEYYQYLAGCD